MQLVAGWTPDPEKPDFQVTRTAGGLKIQIVAAAEDSESPANDEPAATDSESDNPFEEDGQ